MAISGNGREYDITFLADSSLQTSTASGGNGTMQYRCVGFSPGTSTQTDRLVGLCANTGTLSEPTATGEYVIGINQTMMSANAAELSVRMFGVSKAVCAQSIGAGNYVMAYGGASGLASTTTMAGRIVQVDNGVTGTAYGQTITAQTTILGRALEDGSTGTVISIMINPQLYDKNLVGTIATT